MKRLCRKNIDCQSESNLSKVSNEHNEDNLVDDNKGSSENINGKECDQSQMQDTNYDVDEEKGTKEQDNYQADDANKVETSNNDQLILSSKNSSSENIGLSDINDRKI